MSSTGPNADEHEHHAVADVLHLEGGTGRPGDATTEQLMANAIGG